MNMDKHFTKFPSDILEALCRYRLSPLQYQIILYIVRKVEGYQKYMDFIAVSKMARDIERPRCKVSTAVNELERMNIIEVKRTGKRIGNKMRVKSPSEWSRHVTKSKHVTKTEHVTKSKRQLLRKRNAKCYENGTHNRYSTIDNSTKDTPYIPQEEKRAIGKSFGEMYTEEELQKLTEEGWE